MSNLFTPTRTVIKLDYWGQPYEATVTGREELNLATLWQLWRTRTAEAEAHAAEHGLYERGHHSNLKTGNSETLNLIDHEQL